MARIVLNTFGSFGDLHPFLALAIELQARGHQAVVATAEVYRQKVMAEGVGFAPVRPDLGPLMEDRKLIEEMWDARRGTENLLRKVILPVIEQSFDDLREVARGADLLITHTAGFAGPIVAEQQKLPWLSVALQPLVFFSRYDPPVLGPATWVRHFYGMGTWVFALVRWAARRATRRLIEPILELRRRLGLPANAHPIFEGQFSPWGTLALFSEVFARPQPDWPPHTTTTGFVFYDKLGAGFAKLDQRLTELERFLAQGPAPLLFTLGSSAVMQPGRFFEESIAAAAELGMRAVLLVGDREMKALRATVFAAPYAPFSILMPQVAAIVHQGGIGTTAQALRAGRPMLMAPWAHDQADNAERLRRMGVSRTLGKARYRKATVVRELRELLTDQSYSRRAEAASKQVSLEQGARVASDRIEVALRQLRPA